MSLMRRSLLAMFASALGAVAAGVHAQTPTAATGQAEKKLSAEERLEATGKLYKSVKSYRDDGMLTQEMTIQGRQIKSEKPFSTAIERGGRFHWQFRHSSVPGAKADQRYAIWSKDGKTFDSLWTLNGRRETGQSLDLPLAGATGVSGGSATAIIPLLKIGGETSAWGVKTIELVKPEDQGREEVDKVTCTKISGQAKVGDSKVTLWIDDEGLIRKIYEETLVDPAKLPANIRRGPAIPAFTSYTTMTFKPIINEANIDDSKFAEEGQ